MPDLHKGSLDVNEVKNPEANNYKEETPLHIASYYGQTEVVKYLVSKGANKNAKDHNGQTPYDISCND